MADLYGNRIHIRYNIQTLTLIYVSIVCADGSFWDFFYQLIATDKQKPKLSERIDNASQ